ncbi:MAG: helix-turn-helix transcriptional regulator [Nitrospina sp.]|nr:helix-turn-helix transcriptional regulator [Nitrospina sp.]
MVDKNEINSDGSCPFSVSDNLKIEAASYDLNLDGIIIRYGSISGFRATDLVAPFHGFLMNVSDHDIAWEISSGNSRKEVLMEPNQIFFNPANVPFSRYTTDHYEFILVLVEPEKMISAAPIASNSPTFTETYQIKDPNLEYIFKLLLSEIQAGNKNGKLFIENIVSILAFHFVKNYSKEQSSGLVENVSGFTSKEIEKAFYYIDKNMSESVKIENLAEEFGISKFNFIKRFKSSTNVTPHQFIIRKKLERSKNLLKEGSLSLTDITYMLNFSDQSHFSNSFKKMYGMTPREFRMTIQ